jgi:release factor glutamine methyltransferase
MTLQEVLQKTSNFFQQRGLERSRQEAEFLFCAALDLRRIDLYLQYDRPLQELELSKLRDWVKRRAQGEPLAYLCGYTEFYKSRFRVSPGVLIPRPETESLVEIALQKMAKRESGRALDLGSGSGVIGLSLANEMPSWTVDLVEADPFAFEITLRNRDERSLQGRVNAFHQRAEDFLSQSRSFYDLIAANPPYIDVKDPDVDASVRNYEPAVALFSEDQGMSHLKSWILLARPLLKPGGMMIFEMGANQKQALAEFLASFEVPVTFEFYQDLFQRDRGVILYG